MTSALHPFQVNLVSQFLNDNLAEPIELLWLAHDRINHREDGHRFDLENCKP
jgi:hypothetical protein